MTRAWRRFIIFNTRGVARKSSFCLSSAISHSWTLGGMAIMTQWHERNLEEFWPVRKTQPNDKRL